MRVREVLCLLLVAGCSRTPRRSSPPAVPSAALPATRLPAARSALPPPALPALPRGAHARLTPSSSPVPLSARQLLLSVATHWNSSAVELSRYERSAAGAPWRQVGNAWRAIGGRSGLAWGRGLHGNGAPPGQDGPIKVEGDGRAVAGVFRLGPAFGYAGEPPAGTRLRYTRSGARWRCVDDPTSRHYGELLDTRGVTPDWHSAEHLHLHSDLYRLLIVVQHNSTHAPGAGSCVFLHVWKGPRIATSGCTAMPYPRIEELFRWLDPTRAVFVALPRGELDALAPAWRLPAVAARALRAGARSLRR